MAKRKAARAKGRKTAGTRAGAIRARSRAAGSARKTGARLRKASARQARLRKASAGQAARKGAARKGPARKVAVRKVAARKVAAPKVARLRQAPARQAAPKKSPAPRLRSGQAAAARKVPALNRERRIVRDDDIVPTPPSSLDLDRSASAARTGRRELVEKFHQHTETSPAITGGDIDADWESASTVGDEAPGGDNMTPDQDIVDDIGKALGVQYEDNEELKGEKKISDRDKKRWELDPASSDDYNDR